MAMDVPKYFMSDPDLENYRQLYKRARSIARAEYPSIEAILKIIKDMEKSLLAETNNPLSAKNWFTFHTNISLAYAIYRNQDNFKEALELIDRVSTILIYN